MADLTTKQVLQKLGKDILNWVKTNCVDNLVSTSKNLPLSANQGRVLKEGQDAINQSLGNKVELIWASKTITFNANGDTTFESTDKIIVAVRLHEVYSDVSICVIGKTYVLHSIGLHNQTVTITYAYY